MVRRVRRRAAFVLVCALVAPSGGCGESGAREASYSAAEESPQQPREERRTLGSLEDARSKLLIPPAWLPAVQTHYDTSLPWKDARLEVRRLLALGDEEHRREALKLMWIYREKGDFSDGHEYPMYTFLGAEPAWSVVAHEEFLAQPAGRTAMHAYRSLASLYSGYGEYEKAKAVVLRGLENLPPSPWDVVGRAELLEVLGDVYVAWGNPEAARAAYAEAAQVFPTARPTYGRHLLPKKAARVRAKLDLLSARSLASASLRDGDFDGSALGFYEDVDVTVSVRKHRVDSVRVRHRETMTRDAEHIVPKAIVTGQTLDVDGVTGATQTRDAIVAAALQALRKAGLE